MHPALVPIDLRKGDQVFRLLREGEVVEVWALHALVRWEDGEEEEVEQYVHGLEVETSTCEVCLEREPCACWTCLTCGERNDREQVYCRCRNCPWCSLPEFACECDEVPGSATGTSALGRLARSAG